MLAERQARPAPRRYALPDQARALAVVLREEFGAAFAFHDAADGDPVPCGDEPGAAAPLGRGEVADVVSGGRARVAPLVGGGYRLALLLYHAGRPVLVAAAELPGLGAADPERERARLQKWAQAVAERLRLSDHIYSGAGEGPNAAGAAGTPAVAWEALLTLDHLIRRTRIHKDAARVQQRALEGAFALLHARALVWVPPLTNGRVVVLGEPCLAPADCRRLADCLAELADPAAAEPVFCDDVQAAPWGARFPHLASLLAFPVADQGPRGWLIAVNKKSSVPRPSSLVAGKEQGTRDEGHGTATFRKSDAALLTPFVALLELHARSSRRYQDLKELLVGLTRSLTAALDAKDSYTYGHSERVARIAVELGRELGLSPDDLSDIYLAGLLHDVGKIGIRDSVLTKPGPLTREEFEHIKQHVTIGYTILSELHPLRNLLPGVLWHHERWDGGGYPDGLAGEAIPLLARILAVADAYDAMSTARPYRDALPPPRVEEVLTQGAGSQWDARVVGAFERCRQKVHAIRQRGVGESLCAAIDGALRSADGSHVWPAPTGAGG